MRFIVAILAAIFIASPTWAQEAQQESVQDSQRELKGWELGIQEQIQRCLEMPALRRQSYLACEHAMMYVGHPDDPAWPKIWPSRQKLPRDLIELKANAPSFTLMNFGSNYGIHLGMKHPVPGLERFKVSLSANPTPTWSRLRSVASENPINLKSSEFNTAIGLEGRLIGSVEKALYAGTRWIGKWGSFDDCDVGRDSQGFATCLTDKNEIPYSRQEGVLFLGFSKLFRGSPDLPYDSCRDFKIKNLVGGDSNGLSRDLVREIALTCEEQPVPEKVTYSSYWGVDVEGGWITWIKDDYRTQPGTTVYLPEKFPARRWTFGVTVSRYFNIRR